MAMKSNGRGNTDEVARLTEALRRESEQYIQVLAAFDSYRQRIERERKRTEQELASTQAREHELIRVLRAAIENISMAVNELSSAPEAAAERLRATCVQLSGAIPSSNIIEAELVENIEPSGSDEARSARLSGNS